MKLKQENLSVFKQDVAVALMNLRAIEEKTSCPQLRALVCDTRENIQNMLGDKAVVDESVQQIIDKMLNFDVD